MLIHHLSRGTPEHRMAGHHLPEHHAQRVEVGADVHANAGELLRTSELRCTSKSSGSRNRSFSGRVGCGLCQPKVNDFGCYSAPLLDTHHDVAWFDISVDEVSLVHRSKTGGCLRHNFQRQLHLQSAGAFDKVLERFPLHKLHRVEVILTTSPEVEDRGNIRMADAGRRTRLAQETETCRLFTEIFFAYDFQSHGAVQIDVERFVSDAHRTATQLARFPVFALHQFVMLKAMCWQRGR